VTDPTNVIIDINGYYATPLSLPLTGTAAAPALTFADTTTGLCSDTAGTVSIATGGTSRLTVRSDGIWNCRAAVSEKAARYSFTTWDLGTRLSD
jgi:hypothetical protein